MKTNSIPAHYTGLIQLKKVKHIEAMSEETNCFHAEVWVNGRRAFHASNEGHGGSDHITPISYDAAGRKAMEEGVAALTAHAATLPPDTSHGITLEWDVELLVSTALAQFLDRKEDVKQLKRFGRIMTSSVLFIEGGKLSHTVKRAGFTPDAKFFAMFAAKHPAAKILNTMPESERDALLLRFMRGESLD